MKRSLLISFWIVRGLQNKGALSWAVPPLSLLRVISMEQMDWAFSIAGLSQEAPACHSERRGAECDLLVITLRESRLNGNALLCSRSFVSFSLLSLATSRRGCLEYFKRPVGQQVFLKPFSCHEAWRPQLQESNKVSCDDVTNSQRGTLPREHSSNYSD